MRRLGLAAAALVCLAAIGWAGWTSGWLPRSSPSRPVSVLLVSIDTLRADHLGSYGYAAASTPVLDRLAASGLRFAQAATVAPLTLPAHTSLMTGTFPTFHGVRDNGGFYVGDEQITLAEVLKDHGYRTGGFVGAFVLDRRWGIAQGFDRYADDFDLAKYDMTAGLDAAQHPGQEVVDKALAWLAEDRDHPFFAWVHLYEPHSPYTPPEPFRSRFPATTQGAYDGEIATADAQVGRLLDYLDTNERRDNTVVIVVGDHGEGLGDHQEQQHGFFVYDASVHIPLIIAGHGVPVRVVPDQVRIVDVMPTVLELTGVPAPAPVQGASLMPLARGEKLELLAYSETWYPRHHYGWSELTAVRDGRYKLIAAPRRELYDTVADPGETTNLATTNARMADALQVALRELSKKTSASATPQAPRAVDPAVEERLRALGYVGTTVSESVMKDRPRADPKDTIGLYNLLKLAAEDSLLGRLDAGMAKVREVLKADPQVVEAHTMLGNMHTKAGRLTDAIAAYRQALSIDPEHEGATWSLALAYRDVGKTAEAEAGFERVLQLNARNTKAIYQLADFALTRREFAKAAELLERGLALDANRPVFLVRLAEARIALRQFSVALTALNEAIAARPDLPMAHFDLGLALEATGDPQGAARAYEAEVAVSPKLYEPHFNLAKILAAAGRPAQALEHYRAAVAANPDFGTGYLYLAKALADAGDALGAEAAAKRGLAAHPDPAIAPLGHYVLADVYTRLGRNGDAARQVALGQQLERAAAGAGRR